MMSLWRSSYGASRAWRSLLVAALPLGLAAACGSSSPPPPAQSAYSIGGGPLPAGAEAAGPALTSITSAVPGLSSSQAATGVGALLALAHQKMPPDQFAQVSNSIPGSDALINGAVSQGLPVTMGGLSSLDPVFKRAGISQEQAAAMVPAVGKVVSDAAGPTVGQAFMSVMK